MSKKKDHSVLLYLEMVCARHKRHLSVFLDVKILLSGIICGKMSVSGMLVLLHKELCVCVCGCVGVCVCVCPWVFLCIIVKGAYPLCSISKTYMKYKKNS